MRDNKFLEDMLYDLWEEYFCDIPRKNFVVVKFGKYSKRQLGSIKIANGRTKIKSLLNKKMDEFLAQDIKVVTVITVTRYFQYDVVPEYVVRATIAHELCHYAHGFNSPLEKRFRNPHKGNIINKELDNRGLLEEQLRADKWLKDNWLGLVLK